MHDLDPQIYASDVGAVDEERAADGTEVVALPDEFAQLARPRYEVRFGDGEAAVRTGAGLRNGGTAKQDRSGRSWTQAAATPGERLVGPGPVDHVAYDAGHGISKIEVEEVRIRLEGCPGCAHFAAGPNIPSVPLESILSVSLSQREHPRLN